MHNPYAKGSSPRYKLFRDNVVIAKPKGVTTILGVLAKDFVSWALDSMENELKEKCPNITLEDLADAKLASTRKRDAGASTGTEAHAMVETFLKGTVPTGSFSPEATKAYRAFFKWFNEVHPTVVNVEEVIYSVENGFAGTYDCTLEIDGTVYLCDLKTTNVSRNAPQGVYPEYFIQLGAYALAHEEQRKFEEMNGGTKLRPIEDLMVISAKKDGKMDIIKASDLDLSVEECMDMFKRVLSLYHYLAFATKELKGGK